MHTNLKTCQKYSSRPWTGKEEYITKTIQHMDKAKVIKNYKFKDVMKNHYSIMFFEDELKLEF